MHELFAPRNLVLVNLVLLALVRLFCSGKERSRCGSSSARGEPLALREGVTGSVRSGSLSLPVSDHLFCILALQTKHHLPFVELSSPSLPLLAAWLAQTQSANSPTNVFLGFAVITVPVSGNLFLHLPPFQ